MLKYNLGDVLELNGGSPRLTVITASRNGRAVLCAYEDCTGTLLQTPWLPVQAVRAAK